MSRSDAEGAKAAAEYFLTLVPYVYATGDLERWLIMADEECNYCRSIADDVETLNAEGGFVGELNAEVSVHTAEPADEAPDAYIIEASVTESSSLRYSPADDQPVAQEGGQYELTVVAYQDKADWIIAGVEVR